jgi:LysM repeat protein
VQLQITILRGVTVTSELHSESTEGSLVRERRPALPAVALATQRLCPYLVADGFSWRSASASRDHRCGAVAPPVPLSVDKQRRLCLVNRHVSCPTYVAATHLSGRQVDAAGDGPSASDQASRARTNTRQPGGEAITRWSIVRTVPVLLDGRDLPRAAISAVRTAGGREAALVGLLGVAFIVIAGSRLAGGSPPREPVMSPRPTAVVAAVDATPVMSPLPSEGPPVAATAAPTPVATSQPVPGATLPATLATRTYIVRRGDTLYEIARRFHTTVATIQELNGLGSSTMLHAGDVLKLP